MYFIKSDKPSNQEVKSNALFYASLSWHVCLVGSNHCVTSEIPISPPWNGYGLKNKLYN